MLRFLSARLVLLVAGLVLASVLVFLTLRVLPGDVAQVLGGMQATDAQLRAIRENLGLDRPLIVQYLDWVGGLVRFDLGNSLVTGSPVAAELAQKAQVTVPLALLSLLFSILISFPLGFLAAVHHRRPSGTILSFGAQAVASIPAVWAGMVLAIVFGLVLGWLPVGGFPRDGWADPGKALVSLILPAITIALIEGAVLLRFVRSAVLEVIGTDYVRAGAAHGRTRTQALLIHGLPNAGLSLVTVFGLQVATVLVGAVVIEQLFNLPGIGRMLVGDVGGRDLVKVQSEIFVMTAFVLVVGFAIDIVHRLIDPRQRQRAA
ncbi:ABC transporter permease [Plantibacter sp. Mn2098]|uniref:ABC transporter permease n=1 Tax=Plantibacter sp. Mn2098 TaxID=3395266 RepID=UPI003BDEB7E7